MSIHFARIFFLCFFLIVDFADANWTIKANTVTCALGNRAVGQTFLAKSSKVLQHISLPTASEAPVQMLLFDGAVDPYDYDPSRAIYSQSFTPDAPSSKLTDWPQITLDPEVPIEADQLYTVVWSPSPGKNMTACFCRCNIVYACMMPGYGHFTKELFKDVTCAMRIEGIVDPCSACAGAKFPISQCSLIVANGDSQDCCKETGVCHGSSCTVLGFQKSEETGCPDGGLNCNQVFCNYTTPNCQPDKGNELCYGTIQCNDHSTTCNHYGKWCLGDGTATSFKVCG